MNRALYNDIVVALALPAALAPLPCGLLAVPLLVYYGRWWDLLIGVGVFFTAHNWVAFFSLPSALMVGIALARQHASRLLLWLAALWQALVVLVLVSAVYLYFTAEMSWFAVIWAFGVGVGGVGPPVHSISDMDMAARRGLQGEIVFLLWLAAQWQGLSGRWVVAVAAVLLAVETTLFAFLPVTPRTD